MSTKSFLPSSTAALIPKELSSLPTPCCIIDKNKMLQNAMFMNERMKSLGISLRPHVKTLKCPQATKLSYCCSSAWLLFGAKKQQQKVENTNVNDAGGDKETTAAKKMQEEEEEGKNSGGNEGGAEACLPGITVSTFAEAKLFAREGFKDILYAVGIEPSKIPFFADLILHDRQKYQEEKEEERKKTENPANQGGKSEEEERRKHLLKVTLITDNWEGIRLVASLVEEINTNQDHFLPNDVDGGGKEGATTRKKKGEVLVTFPVLIEIDCGQHRGGVLPNSPELLQIANSISTECGPWLTFAGVLTHSGHAYHCPGESQGIAEEERRQLLLAVQRLKELNLDCEIVSAGSTPTCLHRENGMGLTECRAGVYLTQDLDQSRIGKYCNDEDIAIAVLTTVIGHQKEGCGALIIDAGGLALSKDISAQEKGVPGYGLVLNEPQLYVSSVSQEHGWVKVCVSGCMGADHRWKLKERQEAESDNTMKEEGMKAFFEKYPVGSKLRILPHHACFTAAPYAILHAWDSEKKQVEEWESAVGWY